MPTRPRPARFADDTAVRAEYGDELVDRVVAQAFLSDEPADALITAFGRLPGGEGWRLLDAALDGQRTPRAPKALAQVVAPALHPPDWVDFELVDAGAVAWWRVGALPQLLALTSGSLAFGYGSANLARPLAMTGRLTQMAPRRLAETSRWVLSATKPGNLRPGMPGVHDTVRLRMVHALVRQALRRKGWDEEDLGVPINVADTLATSMAGFYTVPMRAMEDMGVRFSPAEKEAIAHLWAWISLLMGVPEEHLLRSHAEAERWERCALKLDPGPIEESSGLLHALLYSSERFDGLPRPAGAVATQVSAHVFGALARRWMGDARADELGAPDTLLKHLVPLARPANRLRDIARASGILGSDARIVAFELGLTERLMGLRGGPQTQISPQEVEREPLLQQRAA